MAGAKTISVSAHLLPLAAGPLTRAAFEVVPCSDPASSPLTARACDLLIWDPFRAGGDVREACRSVRDQVRVPILAVSSRREPEACIAVLEAGMDAFLALPVHAEELVARVKALLRRSTWAQDLRSSSFKAGNMEVDVSRHQVRHGGSTIPLRPREFALLVELLRHRNQVLTRDQLLNRVWGLRGPYHRTVDVHILRLRAQLRAAGVTEPSILTVRRIGYCLATAGTGRAGVRGVGQLAPAPMPWPWLRQSRLAASTGVSAGRRGL
jgi:DNA-binding response OmpR family regulator